MKKIDLVIDLQFGSTGKGLIVGTLATYEGYDTVITAWAPNAGHTFIDAKGRKFVHTHLANGIVAPYLRRVLLGPGSVINPAQLLAEIEQCKDIIDAKNIRILIHPHAAVVTEEHLEEEAQSMTAIGSTKKGVGAAMISRIRRQPNKPAVAKDFLELASMVCTTAQYQRAIRDSEHILIEGAQGVGLSLYHGFYPYTTSRDVSTFQILADCGIPATLFNEASCRVIGTARTYPIRVANRYDSEGRQIGYSGPAHLDQKEISFEEIGQPIELTTVTKLPRRIFTFSRDQIREAIDLSGASEVFLNFANYVQDEQYLLHIVNSIEETGARVKWLGLGPDIHSVVLLSEGENYTARRKEIVSKWQRYKFRNKAGA